MSCALSRRWRFGRLPDENRVGRQGAFQVPPSQNGYEQGRTRPNCRSCGICRSIGGIFNVRRFQTRAAERYCMMPVYREIGDWPRRFIRLVAYSLPVIVAVAISRAEFCWEGHCVDSLHGPYFGDVAAAVITACAATRRSRNFLMSPSSRNLCAERPRPACTA
jgi:hypothetical protein